MPDEELLGSDQIPEAWRPPSLGKGRPTAWEVDQPMTTDEQAPVRCQQRGIGRRPMDMTCFRNGYETYTRDGRTKIIRCWQHDPLRGIDEGEEAYRDHLA